MNSTFSKNRVPKRKSHLLAELTGHLDLAVYVRDVAIEAVHLVVGLVAHGAGELLRDVLEV